MSPMMIMVVVVVMVAKMVMAVVNKVATAVLGSRVAIKGKLHPSAF